MQKHKNTIIIIAVLGVITALATGSNLKNIFYSFQGNSGFLSQQRMAYETMPVQNMGATMDMKMGVGGDGYGYGTSSYMPEPGMYPYYGEDYALDVEQRVYEKSSNHNLVVNNVSEYMQQTREYLSSIGGKIINSSSGTTELYQENPFINNKYQYGYMYAKVPVEKFDEVQNRVTAGVKKVVNESVDAYDQTGQVVNTQENLKVLQDRKLELEIKLADAKTDAEKRTLELQISRLETQISNAEKQVSNVEQRIEYANINISFADNERYFNPGYGHSGFANEFYMAWNSLSIVLFKLLKLGVWVLVYSILWLPVILIYKLIKNRRQQ